MISLTIDLDAEVEALSEVKNPDAVGTKKVVHCRCNRSS